MLAFFFLINTSVTPWLGSNPNPNPEPKPNPNPDPDPDPNPNPSPSPNQVTPFAVAAIESLRTGHMTMDDVIFDPSTDVMFDPSGKNRLVYQVVIN
jgi:hypothetical protein